MNKIDKDPIRANGAAMKNKTPHKGSDPNERPDFFRPDKVNTTRATLFYAVGVVGGLILGGIGLFNARGTTTNTVPPEDLALVNQVPVLRSDFINQLENETGQKFDESSREQKLKVLDEMLREELLVQRGLELNFAETDQASRNALVSAVEQQAIADVTTSQPTEEQLKKQYETYRSRYSTEGTMTVHNLLVLESPDKDDAKDRASAAADALKNNMPLLEVEQKYGLVLDRLYDDDFYFAAKIHLGDKIYNEVVNLNPGDIAGPIVTDDGYHVVQMVKNTRPVPLSFERARSQVLTDYKNFEQARLMNNTVSFLRNRSKIMIAKDYAGDYNPNDFLNSYTP